MRAIEEINFRAKQALASALEEAGPKGDGRIHACTVQTLMKICIYQQAQIEALQRHLIEHTAPGNILYLIDPCCGH